jgi:hypothetical protein
MVNLMQNKRTRNLGETSLRARRYKGNPMEAYDALPSPLRNWLSQATLPWSPASAKRVWARERAKGLSVESALQTLTLAETRTLARDKHATPTPINRAT